MEKYYANEEDAYNDVRNRLAECHVVELERGLFMPSDEEQVPNGAHMCDLLKDHAGLIKPLMSTVYFYGEGLYCANPDCNKKWTKTYADKAHTIRSMSAFGKRLAKDSSNRRR